jgi:hypothetical protein
LVLFSFPANTIIMKPEDDSQIARSQRSLSSVEM